MLRTVTTAMVCLVMGVWICGAEEVADAGLEPLDIGVDAVPGPQAGVSTTQEPRCLKREPVIREVLDAAWDEAGLSPEEDRSRMTRVRAAAWLPKLSGGVVMDLGDRRDYRYEPGAPRVDEFQLDDGLRWDAGITWDLARTVFRSEELSVAREAARRTRERLDLAAEIIRIYFARRRLMKTGVPAAGTDAALSLAEANATLDAWTGNRFRGRWCEVAP